MQEYYVLDNEQRRNFLNNVQLFEAYTSTLQDQQHYRGGMTWQQVADKTYLVRTIDARTKKSLGARTAATESLYTRFYAEKASVNERINTLQAQIQRQSKVCRALNLGRIPRLTGNILRHLATLQLDQKTTTIIGTHALYAYEAMAGVQFKNDILATNDLDVLWDARSRLKIASQIPPEGMIAILKKVDQSFTIMDRARYRAINKAGFMVDMIRDMVDMRINPSASFTLDDAFVAVEADMKWLISSPKTRSVTLDEDGYPVPMSVPDPRAFALHKFWLSSKMDRDPLKKPRDLAQSIAVIKIIEDYLPQYAFSEKALRMFPKRLVMQNSAQITKQKPSSSTSSFK